MVAAAAGDEAFSVLLSRRSDYYAAWQRDRALFDMAERLDVLAPEGAVLGEIIRRPAEVLKARFESGDTTDRAAAATEREPGSLPLLSDLLHEMWINMQRRGDGELRWVEAYTKRNLRASASRAWERKSRAGMPRSTNWNTK